MASKKCTPRPRDLNVAVYLVSFQCVKGRLISNALKIRPGTIGSLASCEFADCAGFKLLEIQSKDCLLFLTAINESCVLPSESKISHRTCGPESAQPAQSAPSMGLLFSPSRGLWTILNFRKKLP